MDIRIWKPKRKLYMLNAKLTDKIILLCHMILLMFVSGINSRVSGNDKHDFGSLQLALESNTLQYNQRQDVVTASGNVRISFANRSVVADKVIYNRVSKKIFAVGNVTITDKDATIITGDKVNISQDFSAGYLEKLFIITKDKTYFAAKYAKRVKGRYLIFYKGVYTACKPCKKDSSRSPLWQIRANKIIHDENEQSIQFEGASLEFYGLPIIYLPSLTIPDWKAKHRSGFLVPSFSYSKKLGFGYKQPYIFVTGENSEIIFNPVVYSNQGILLDAKFRHKLSNGEYNFTLTGVKQWKLAKFPVGSFGNKSKLRGSISSKGDFKLNDIYDYGWDLTATSDRSFLTDYKRGSSSDSFINNIYISRLINKSYIDMRFLQFRSNEGGGSNRQSLQPIVWPKFYYENHYDDHLLGGEASVKFDFANFSRSEGSYVLYKENNDAGSKFTESKVHGSVHSVLGWKRIFVAPLGLLFEPSFDLFSSIFWNNGQALRFGKKEGISNTDNFKTRLVPSTALKISWPILIESSIADVIIEPVAQIIARPNEKLVGEVPTEDTGELLLYSGNLFNQNRFFGWDRLEGGVRANIGTKLTVFISDKITFKSVLGQAYHLKGQNSYTLKRGGVKTANSGLNSKKSDIVFGTGLDVSGVINARLFSEMLFMTEGNKIDSLELGGQVSYKNFKAGLIYKSLSANKLINFDKHQEISLELGVPLGKHLKLSSTGIYNINSEKWISRGASFTYEDDCFLFGLNYTESLFNFEQDKIDRSITFSIGLRTLGDFKNIGNL